MSTLNVEGIKNTAATTDAISFATDGTCTARLTNPRSHRNLVINGAMAVAQRGTSSTTSGYGDVDRWQHEYGGTNENPTFAQVDIASGDAPYLVGLTRAAKITNGNQTSGLQTNSQINFMQPIEAQDIRNSGQNYKSASSYITLSYWVRASVAQEYHGFVKTADGSNYVYPFSLGSLSANTWTKITKTIPGNTNLQIDNNNGAGFQVWPVAFYGTDYTDNSVTNNAWAAWASGGRSKNQTSTWWTTNDATFEITGVQLEVGDTATDFEHRTYADEILRCYRYFYKAPGYNSHAMFSRADTAVGATVNTPVPMRTAPTSGPTNWVRVQRPGVDYGDSSAGSWTVGGAAPADTLTGSTIFFQYGSMSNVTNATNNIYGFLTYDLELTAEL